MLKTISIAISLFCIKTASAQYYFQDIVSGSNSSKNFLLLKANKIKSVTVSSIEPDGNETEGFGISQKVNANLNQLTTVTESSQTGIATLITNFNKVGFPEKLVDSSTNLTNIMNYWYDAEGRLLKLSSQSRDPEDTNKYTITEDHLFTYNSAGQLVSMLRIKDRFDTLLVKFIPAEKGLPGEEQWWKNNRKTENWFYYYDDKGQLTDVVRYNPKYKKMIPDYVFEYNEAGQIASQTVVQPGTSFFRLWMYEYDGRGLKKAETIFKKGKEQEGRIIYEYE
jgi:hypothetical protein